MCSKQQAWGTHTLCISPYLRLYGELCQVEIRKCNRKRNFSISELCCKGHFSTRDIGGGRCGPWQRISCIFIYRLEKSQWMEYSLHPSYNQLGGLRLPVHIAEQEKMNIGNATWVIIKYNRSFGLLERDKKNNTGVFPVRLTPQRCFCAASHSVVGDFILSTLMKETSRKKFILLQKVGWKCTNSHICKTQNFSRNSHFLQMGWT